MEPRQLPLCTINSTGLKLHPDTVKTILEKLDECNADQVNFVSVIFRSDLKLESFEGGNAKLEEEVTEHFNADDPTGIYAQPGIFSQNEQNCVILLHLHRNKTNQQIRTEKLIDFICLISSRIMEINYTNSEFSILKSAHRLTCTTFPPRSEICGDIVLVMPSQMDIPNSRDENRHPEATSFSTETNNPQVYDKISSVFFVTDPSSNDHINQKILSKNRRNLLEANFSISNLISLHPQRVFKYIAECVQFLNLPLLRRSTSLTSNDISSTNTSETHLLNMIVDGVFYRNSMKYAFQNGCSETFLKLISGNFKINRKTVSNRYFRLVAAIKLSPTLCRSFLKHIIDICREESAHFEWLGGMLKIAHKKIVDSALERNTLSFNIIVDESIAALRSQQKLPNWVKNIVTVLPEFFNHINSRELIMNCTLLVKCLQHAKLKYGQLVQNVISAQSYYPARAFAVMNATIFSKCVDGVIIALGFSKNQITKLMFQIYMTEDYFATEFSRLRDMNFENLERTCKSIKKLVMNAKASYDLQMQQAIKSNSAMRSEDFESIHMSALTHVLQNVEKKIIFNEEMEHLKSLHVRISKAYEDYFARCKHLFVIEATTTRNTNLVTITIQMTLDKLRCQVIVDNNSNWSGKQQVREIQLCVAFLKDGSLLLGDDYEDYFKRNKCVLQQIYKEFKFRDCWMANDWSEANKVRNNDVEINQSTLLVLIFKDIKAKVEHEQCVLIDKVVLILPNWFPDAVRHNLKNVLGIAGFSHVEFVDELFATSCSTVKYLTANAEKSNILALSENSDVVEIGLLSYHKCLNKIELENYDRFKYSKTNTMGSQLRTNLKNLLEQYSKNKEYHFHASRHMIVKINFENAARLNVMEGIATLIAPGNNSEEFIANVHRGAMLLSGSKKIKTSISLDACTVDIPAEHNLSRKVADNRNVKEEAIVLSAVKSKENNGCFEFRNKQMIFPGAWNLEQLNPCPDVIAYAKVKHSCSMKRIKDENSKLRDLRIWNSICSFQTTNPNLLPQKATNSFFHPAARYPVHNSN